MHDAFAVTPRPVRFVVFLELELESRAAEAEAHHERTRYPPHVARKSRHAVKNVR